MEWLVEFEDRRLPLEAIWSHDMAKLVGPLKSMVDSALAVSNPDDIEGLKIVLYADAGVDGGPAWGFKLVGPPHVVDHARRLIGDAAAVRPSIH